MFASLLTTSSFSRATSNFPSDRVQLGVNNYVGRQLIHSTPCSTRESYDQRG
jgi:hypothetical protein